MYLNPIILGVLISSLIFLYETVLSMLSNSMSNDDCEDDSNTIENKKTSLIVFLLQDLVEHINGLVIGGKKKLLDLSMDCINNSFQIFNSIDWKNEQLNSIKEKIEKLYNRQKPVVTISMAMNSYLPTSFVESVIPEVIKSLVNNYKISLQSMTKLENKNVAKQ